MCGSEWIDHEDCLVGNEQGLRNLITACEAAINDGEFYGSGLDDYVGVKKLDTQFFEKPEDSPTTKMGMAILSVILVSIAGLVIIGGVTVVNWLS
tara:strand:- start:61 stop:345 length:285 start_codon:yes stop_codon:yes gene_type:complete